MSKLVIANWKMNPATVAEAVALANASDIEGIIIAPPYPFLDPVIKTVSRAKVSAQNVFFEKTGAFTGEVSPSQLVSLGVTYSIVGHSEERRIHHETDEEIGMKVAAAISAGLMPIVCVGESSAEREAGRATQVVERQISVALSGAGGVTQIILAYEPLWAIGSGTPETPEEASRMLQLVRRTAGVKRYPFPVQCVYGGSVTPENAVSFLQQEDIDGVLVGGASLDGERIARIAEAARG